MLSHVLVCKGIWYFWRGLSWYIYLFRYFLYVGYYLVCLSMFACKWAYYSKFFDVLVGFCMLCTLLNVLAHHLWVQLSKSTLIFFFLINVCKMIIRWKHYANLYFAFSTGSLLQCTGVSIKGESLEDLGTVRYKWLSKRTMQTCGLGILKELH